MLKQPFLNSWFQTLRTIRLIHVVLLLIAIMIVGYFLQIVSPLRLNNDNVRLIEMALSFLAGEGFTIAGNPSQLPNGYPAYIVLLESFGLAKVPIFIASNIAFIFAGLFMLDRLARLEFDFRVTERLLLCLAVLLNFLFIKFVTLPQSEALYFGTSMIALGLLHTFPSQRGLRMVAIIVSIGLIALSFQVRTIGIMLIPALAVGAFLMLRKNQKTRIILSPRNLLVVLAIGFVLAATTVLLARHTTYFGQVAAGHVQGLPDLPGHFVRKFAVLSQILLNVPDSVAGMNGAPLFAISSPVFLFLIGLGLWRRMSRLAPLDIYLLGYAGLVLLWPFYQTRFWMPVVPILLMYVIEGLRGSWRLRFVQTATICFCAPIVGFGLVAISYSTWLTFSGPEFQNRYGSGSTQIIYQTAFKHETPTFENAAHRNMFKILSRYEPLAKRAR